MNTRATETNGAMVAGHGAQPRTESLRWREPVRTVFPRCMNDRPSCDRVCKQSIQLATQTQACNVKVLSKHGQANTPDSALPIGRREEHRALHIGNVSGENTLLVLDLDGEGLVRIHLQSQQTM